MSSSGLSDPRERTLAWLNAYFIDANVTDDDGNSVTILKCYEEAEYPIELLFIDKHCDVIIAVGDAESNPIRNADKTVHSYREQVPLTVYIADKNGLTATKVKWKVERELRRMAENHIYGSIRLLSEKKPKTIFLGEEQLHAFTYTLNYVRSAN